MKNGRTYALDLLAIAALVGLRLGEGVVGCADGWTKESTVTIGLSRRSFAMIPIQHVVRAGYHQCSLWIFVSRDSLLDDKSDLTINYARGCMLTAQATDLDPAKIRAGSTPTIMRLSVLARSGKARYDKSCFSAPRRCTQ